MHLGIFKYVFVSARKDKIVSKRMYTAITYVALRKLRIQIQFRIALQLHFLMLIMASVAEGSYFGEYQQIQKQSLNR